MRRSRRSSIWIAAFVISTSLLLASVALAAGKKTTLTGEVGDAMCGNKHMEGTPTECTRTCVSKGSKYALVVGDKVYVLDSSDKAVLAVLDQQAGKHATVTGTLTDDKMEVSSAVAAK